MSTSMDVRSRAAAAYLLAYPQLRANADYTFFAWECWSSLCDKTSHVMCSNEFLDLAGSQHQKFIERIANEITPELVALLEGFEFSLADVMSPPFDIENFEDEVSP